MAETEQNQQTPTEQVLIQPLYDRWFTTCKQDHFILVVRGERLVKIISEITDWTPNENFEFVKGGVPLPTGPIDAFAQHQFGRHFVGVPLFNIEGIYRYKFVWSKYRIMEGPDSVHSIETHDAEYIHITPFESQYGFEFKGVEVRGQSRKIGTQDEEPIIPVGFDLTFRVRILRPKIALMTNRGDWFGGGLIPRLLVELKNFAGSRTYEDLVKNNGGKEKASREFYEYIIGKGGVKSEFREMLLEDIGVDLYHIGIANISPNLQYEQSNLDLAAKEKEAQGILVTAAATADGTVLTKTAEAKGKLLLATAEAEGIERITVAERVRLEQTTLFVSGGPGKNAVEVEKWRQLHGSGLTTYVESGNNTPVSLLVGPDGKQASKDS